MTVKETPVSAGGEKVVMTACNSHCGGTCLLKVHVKERRITRIETDDGEDPQFRACLRCRAYRQRVYAPDRLRSPLKRVGERGAGTFEPISWDEALDTVAKALVRIKQTYGQSSILLMYSAGDMGRLNTGDLFAKVFTRATGGYTAHWGWHSNGGGQYASLATYGTVLSANTRDDLLNSRLILLWGWNPTDSVHDTNTSWYLAQAREAGIKIVAVDPRYSASAATFAQQWIPIRPGTDAAMLIAMAYVIMDNNLQDQGFLDRCTVGVDQFKDYVLGKEDGIPKTPAWAESITGVPAAVTVALARDYAASKPAALVAGIAPGRTAYGEQFHRAAMTLAAMTGNIGVHGGNAAGTVWSGPSNQNFAKLGPTVGQRMKGGGNPLDVATPRQDSLPASDRFWKGWTSVGRINRFYVADAILKGKAGGYPVDLKLLYIVNQNCLNQLSNTNKIARALRELEFIVVHDQFMTPTAKFADIVLPSTMFLERIDVTAGGATPFYGYMNKVVEPPDGLMSHFQIAVELARRLGVPDYGEKTEDEWLREIVADSTRIPSYDTFKKQGAYKIRLPGPAISFEKQVSDPPNNPFPTPSGKIEIYSKQLADMKNPMLPPVPKYIETWESRNDPLAAKYPLQLITTHCKRRAHSQFENIPWLREIETQAITMNSADACARDIRDGDKVRIFNDRGEMVIPAIVSERIMPGVVDIPQGAWYDPDEKGVDRGGCVNVLSRDMVSPGEAFPSNTCLVQVEMARPS